MGREKDKMQNITDYSAGIRKTVHCESHSRHEMSKVTESWQVPNVLWCIWYAVADSNAYLALNDCYICGSCMLTGYFN